MPNNQCVMFDVQDVEGSAGLTEGGPLKEALRGAASIAIGGTLAVILYPLLNIYAIQLGFFLSLYGTLKMMIRPGG